MINLPPICIALKYPALSKDWNSHNFPLYSSFRLNIHSTLKMFHVVRTLRSATGILTFTHDSYKTRRQFNPTFDRNNRRNLLKPNRAYTRRPRGLSTWWLFTEIVLGEQHIWPMKPPAHLWPPHPGHWSQFPCCQGNTSACPVMCCSRGT